MKNIFFLLMALISTPCSLLIADEYSIVNTRHNLSISGPGELKSTVETRVCIFCHTPHHANQDDQLETSPLWSRQVSSAEYNPYVPTTTHLATRPGQPTGTSRLCLSCHDGTIALGMLAGGHMLPGIPFAIARERASYIGTDLRNDHPISFPYDSQLFSKDLELVDPNKLSPLIRLENGTNFVQCTTCHDAHRDPAPPNSKFLVIPNYKNGTQLCITCHKKTGWTTNVHATSLTTTADGCENCHKPHGADNTNYPPLLIASYPYTSYQAYQFNTYMLCIRCHPESTLLDPAHPERTNFSNIASTTNKHYSHVVTQQMPCIACHPSHGVNGSGYPHLIDFSPIFVVSGATYDSVQKNCNVVCHTVSHMSNPKYY